MIEIQVAKVSAPVQPDGEPYSADTMVQWLVECVISNGPTTISGAEIVDAPAGADQAALVELVRQRYET